MVKRFQAVLLWSLVAILGSVGAFLNTGVGLAMTEGLAASSEFDDNVGWHFYTVDEPKPRISVIERGEDGTIVIRHGFASMHMLGGRWYDIVQVLTPIGSGYRSLYRFDDGRAPLRTELIRQADGSLIEEYIAADGTENRNVLEFSGNMMTINRFRKNGTQWAAVNSTKKDGWSPARREEKRMADLRAQRQRERESAREMAELRRLMQEEAAARAEAREWGRQVDEANQRGTQSIYDDMRRQADDAGRAADRSRRDLDRTIDRALGRSAEGASSVPSELPGYVSPSNGPGSSRWGRTDTFELPPPAPSKQCAIPARSIEVPWTGMAYEIEATKSWIREHAAHFCGGDPNASVSVSSISCDKDGSCVGQVQCPARSAACSAKGTVK